MERNLKVKEKDVLEILGITHYQLLSRIKEGVYPQPKKNSYNGRFIFTTPWIDTCIINGIELRKAQLRVEKIKQEQLSNRQRYEREIIKNLGLDDD